MRLLLPAGLSLLTAEQRLEWCQTRITHPLLLSESGKFSDWCSADSATCRTGKASEHGDCGDGGEKQLPPIPHTTWTPFALEHLEVINLPKISSPALDWILFALFSHFNFSELEEVKACAVTEQTIPKQTRLFSGFHGEKDYLYVLLYLLLKGKLCKCTNLQYF